MDILRKELNAIYAGQRLADETLDAGILEATLKAVERFAAITQGCCVVTDASADTCHLFGGRFARLLGITEADRVREKVDSSDEDAIYARLHPEDLVEKRMLEYEFFKYVDPLPAEEKTQYKAACTIRIRNRAGDYLPVKNTTQVLVPSRPNGRIWLILCTYDLSPGRHRAAHRLQRHRTYARRPHAGAQGAHPHAARKGNTPPHPGGQAQQTNSRPAEHQHTYRQPPPAEHS